VQLVAGGDEQHVGAGLAGEVGQVLLPALAPGRAPLAGDGSGVGAAQDDAGDVVAEGVADLAFDRCAVVAVLDGVVQQAGDMASSLPPYSSTRAATDIRWAR
jgi:hypothetical protein